MHFNFAYWINHFEESDALDREFSWENSGTLSAWEKTIVGPVLAEFEAGEQSDGLVLRKKARKYLKGRADQSYLEALRLLIAEENRHAGLLTRFLDQESIPRLQNHNNNRLFRLVRRMGPMEWTVSVLMCVEVLSMPCYRAIRDLTKSQVLTQIAAHHLIDESHHLRFQATALFKMLEKRSKLLRTGWKPLVRFLMRGIAGQAWRSYKPFLQQAGYDKKSFCATCRRELDRCLSFAQNESAILDFNFQQKYVQLANSQAS